jgi:hypothetical protein
MIRVALRQVLNSSYLKGAHPVVRIQFEPKID